MSGDPKQLESLVFTLLENNSFPELAHGDFFCGDRAWKHIERYVKRPDIIYFEEKAKGVVSIQPYDVKSSLNNLKLAQVSPINLMQLYENNEFNECLYDHLSMHGLSDHSLVFEEGKFIVPHSPQIHDGMAILPELVDDASLKQHKRKIRRVQKVLGTYAYPVYVNYFSGEKALHRFSSDYDICTDEFVVKTTGKNHMRYTQAEHALFHKTTCAHIIQINSE